MKKKEVYIEVDERDVIIEMIEERLDDVRYILEEVESEGEIEEIEDWMYYKTEVEDLLERVRDGRKMLSDLWYEEMYVDMAYLVDDMEDDDEIKMIYRKYRG